MEERRWKVYKHTCPNGKVYIGITSEKKVEYRWRKDGNGYKSQNFYHAIKKYGWDNIKHEIVAEGLTQQEADQMEQELIAKYKSNDKRYGYNKTEGGDHCGLGGENYNAKRVYCEDMIFDCVRECAEFYGINYSNMLNWVTGRVPMPQEWYDRRLREEEKQMGDYEIQKGTSGENNPNAKKVICDGMIFNYVGECAEFYGINRGTMNCWLCNHRPMPQEWYDKGLRYEDKQMSDYKVQTGVLTGEGNPNAKKVICDGMIFNCIKDCSEYYGVKYHTMANWLNKTNPMPKKWYDKGLRFENETMNNYKIQKGMPKGDTHHKAKKTVCENIIFSSITECAKFYNVNRKTMKDWLCGRYSTPQKFKDLGLRYATEEDILNYPTYDKNIK